ALNIAASPTDLKSYAGRLDIRPRNAKSVSIAAKRDSGLWIIAESDVRMIINAGPIGPDYLPGHAQCDTLSFEMTVLGRRFIVNSGVYTYQGTERNLFRATAAHNTVRIDGEEQHEIWANFRVARRGYPVDVQARDSHGVLLFSAAHTGYQRLKGRPLHRRRISCEANTWTIEDNIEGSGIHEAESFVHLHPQARIVEAGPTTVHCLVADRAVTIETIGGETRVESGYYSPEFGKKHENKVLVMRKKGSVPFSMAYRIVVKPL
ncbi:MAG: heparinase II/III-family protein, partial [Candidatus Krumholzibacteria bacterium]|nr:heparinase II/III-family protein [Candidatus Krumholzibacteria bacterium]